MVYNLISDLVGGIEVIVLEETAGPAGETPRVTLPTAGERATARRASLPPVQRVDGGGKPDQERREAELPRTGT